MYSQSLQDYIQELSAYAEVDPRSVTFLDEILACFLSVLGRSIGAETNPEGDLLTATIHLLALSDGLSSLDDIQLDGAHYLIGLGYEQTGELLARLSEPDLFENEKPLRNDHWYRLTLALLHYLAGGHRVQALSTLRHLRSMSNRQKTNAFFEEYSQAIKGLNQLYSGKPWTEKDRAQFGGVWGHWLFDEAIPSDVSALRVYRLARQIFRRRDTVLGALGLNDERHWLATRGIDDDAAYDFWTAYLKRLELRGITTFTKEQSGAGFNIWLHPGRDTLVILPTGSGKTIVGELRSALALAQGKQVLWILPTRALVRQTQREFRGAFEPLNVIVEELPTTEDFNPLYADAITQFHYVAVTTPEKLAALIRSNREAVKNVGLVVLDEAQILLEGSRGTTAEFVLQQLRSLVPSIDVVLMSAFADAETILSNFLRKLGREPDPLISDTRPTRRAYGILTNDGAAGKQHPLALIYPPGVQQPTDTTDHPFSIHLKSVNLPPKMGPIDIAQRFVRGITLSGLRTAFFVSRRDSAETQATAIAKTLKKKTRATDLPDLDVARLTVELGRESTIEGTSRYRTAPHHAGLTPLEQHMVEKWVRTGVIRTVVATPTLAQGVNLPFDVSVVSFTSRSDRAGIKKELAATEIQNMVGRAGRAGHVSDGLGLIAVARGKSSPTRALDKSRRFFFNRPEMTSEKLGFARLVNTALNAKVDASDWLIELGGASFSESQSLVHLVLEATSGRSDIGTALIERMQLFPSLEQLTKDEVERTASVLESLVGNVQKQLVDDPILTEILLRTGMPIEILRYFIAEIQSIASDWQKRKVQEQIEWADRVVQSALEVCSSRSWYTDLLGKANLTLMFSSVQKWRAGEPIVEIERNWQMKDSGKANQIAVGEFINHKLSLLAQFWGALAVCEEVIFRQPALSENERILQQLPAFVRVGVSSLDEYEWLHTLNGLDRVLAHQLAIVSAPISGILDRRSFFRGQMGRWIRDKKTIPTSLKEPYKTALLGVLEEVQEGTRT
jgi:superfamily II DNA/RNA helicase